MHSYLSVVLPKQVRFWPLIYEVGSHLAQIHLTTCFWTFSNGLMSDSRLERCWVIHARIDKCQILYIIVGFTKVGSIPSVPCSSIRDWSDHFSFLLMVTPANMSMLSSGTLLMEYTYTWTKVELSHSHCILQPVVEYIMHVTLEGVSWLIGFAWWQVHMDAWGQSVHCIHQYRYMWCE